MCLYIATKHDVRAEKAASGDSGVPEEEPDVTVRLTSGGGTGQ